MKNRLYNEFAKEYSEKIRDNVYNSMFDRPNTLSLLKDVSNKTVLDLGCGSGEYTKYLLRENAIVTSIDISEVFISMIKTNFDQVTAYTQDLELGLPKERDNHYDFVISGLTIHYINDLSNLFTEISRVLKDGGEFVFSCHSPIADAIQYKPRNYYETELIKDTWNTIGKPVDVTFYRRSLTSIFAPLLSAGFVITGFTEGKTSEEIKAKSPSSYEYLSTHPNFIFVRAKKCDLSSYKIDKHNHYFDLG
jgi:SAM-dependent methyltransferase